jgi:Ni/Co efflux regulator RcnB
MDTQAPGRVARIHHESGKQTGVVYDFQDHFDRGFKTKSQTRYRNYDKKGWEQIKLDPPGEVPDE